MRGADRGAGEDRFPSRSIGTLVAILVVAAFSRLHALGYEALWCDEAYTALIVRLPFSEMISSLFRIDDAPPLYYTIQKLAVSVLGDSEAGLRSVSALAGISSVAALLWVARQRRSLADLWAAAFLAVATTGIFHSRQARSYSLVLLFATGLVLSARAILFERRRAGPVLAISAALLCSAHHVGIVLVLTSLALWPLGNAGRPRLGAWILLHTPALVIWATSWVAASSQLGVHAELNSWIGHYWETHPLLLAPLYSLGLFLPVGLPASDLSVGFATPGSFSPLWTWISLSLGALCVIVAGRRAMASRRGYRDGAEATTPTPTPTSTPIPNPTPASILTSTPTPTPTPTREFLLEVGFAVLPLLALLIASLIVTPVYVLGRTDVLAYPAFVLLIGRGLAGLPQRLSWWTFGFWGAMSLLSLLPSYGLGPVELTKNVDRRLAGKMIEADLAPGDWVVHTFMTSPTIEYYLDRGRTPHRAGWFPFVAAENTASDYPTPPDSLGAYLEEARQLRSTMEESMPEDGDVWIFGLIAPRAEDSVAEVHNARTATAEQIGYPVSVLVYSLLGRSPAPVAFLYQQDWVAGERVVLRIPRQSWVPPEDLEPDRLEVRP